MYKKEREIEKFYKLRTSISPSPSSTASHLICQKNADSVGCHKPQELRSLPAPASQKKCSFRLLTISNSLLPSSSLPLNLCRNTD